MTVKERLVISIFFNQKEISLKYLKLIDRNKSFEENQSILKKYNI